MPWDQLAIPDFVIWIAIFWCLCGIPGAIVGSIKNAGKQGLLLGTLLGPLGVVAAFALDHRPKCRSCQRPIESYELWNDVECESRGHAVCTDCRESETFTEAG